MHIEDFVKYFEKKAFLNFVSHKEELHSLTIRLCQTLGEAYLSKEIGKFEPTTVQSIILKRFLVMTEELSDCHEVVNLLKFTLFLIDKNNVHSIEINDDFIVQYLPVNFTRSKLQELGITEQQILEIYANENGNPPSIEVQVDRFRKIIIANQLNDDAKPKKDIRQSLINELNEDAKSRALALLEKECPITYGPLIKIIKKEDDACINLITDDESAIHEKYIITIEDLEHAKIQFNNQRGTVYLLADEKKVGEPSRLNQGDNNTILVVQKNSNTIHLPLMNRYISQIIALQQSHYALLKLPSAYFHPQALQNLFAFEEKTEGNESVLHFKLDRKWLFNPEYILLLEKIPPLMFDEEIITKLNSFNDPNAELIDNTFLFLQLDSRFFETPTVKFFRQLKTHWKFNQSFIDLLKNIHPQHITQYTVSCLNTLENPTQEAINELLPFTRLHESYLKQSILALLQELDSSWLKTPNGLAIIQRIKPSSFNQKLIQTLNQLTPDTASLFPDVVETHSPTTLLRTILHHTTQDNLAVICTQLELGIVHNINFEDLNYFFFRALDDDNELSLAELPTFNFLFAALCQQLDNMTILSLLVACREKTEKLKALLNFTREHKSNEDYQFICLRFLKRIPYTDEIINHKIIKQTQIAEFYHFNPELSAFVFFSEWEKTCRHSLISRYAVNELEVYDSSDELSLTIKNHCDYFLIKNLKDACSEDLTLILINELKTDLVRFRDQHTIKRKGLGNYAVRSAKKYIQSPQEYIPLLKEINQKLRGQNISHEEIVSFCQQKLNEAYALEAKMNEESKNNIPLKLSDILNDFLTINKALAGYILQLNAIKQKVLPENDKQALYTICDDELTAMEMLEATLPVNSLDRIPSRLSDTLLNFTFNMATINDTLRTALNNDNLLHLLLNKEIYQHLTADDLARLWEFGNRDLIANIIVNYYGCWNFISFKKVGSIDEMIYFENLYDMVKTADEIDNLDGYNAIRHNYLLPSFIPPGFSYPGGASLDEIKLSAEEAYQLQESDMAVGEHALRSYNDFRGLFYNRVQSNIIDNAEIAESPYYFYSIPIGESMIISKRQRNDGNKSRFKNFKTTLQELINSYIPDQHAKPIIFTGTANVNGVHFIPYFVYKNKCGKIFVITVDPSPEKISLDAEGILDDKEKANENSKLIASIDLSSIFEEIFPHCIFTDPFITQQLRERDCGINSLQTQWDALATARTDNPLLLINSEDELQINCTQLSVNGYNYQHLDDKNRYFYAPEFKQQCRENRKRWTERLTQYDRVINYIPQRKNANEPLSIKTEEIAESFQEYNYLTNVKTQQECDDGLVIYNEITGLIIQKISIEELHARFIDDDLKISTPDEIQQLALFIRQHLPLEVLNQVTQNNQIPLSTIIEKILAINIHDKIKDALIISCENFANALNEVSLDMTSGSIIQLFLNERRKGWLDQLSLEEKRQIEKTWLINTEVMLLNKKFQLCNNIIHEYLSLHLRTIINHNVQENNIIAYLTQEIIPICKEVEFLSNYNKDTVLYIVNSIFTKLIADISQSTFNLVKQKNAIATFSLSQCLEHLSNNQSSLFTLDYYQSLFDANAPTDFILPLQLNEFNTSIGLAIIDPMNQYVREEIAERIKILIMEKIHLFCQIPELLADFDKLDVIELFDHKMQLIHFPRSILQTLVSRHGTEQSLSIEYFESKAISELLETILAQKIDIILNQKLAVKIGYAKDDVINHCMKNPPNCFDSTNDDNEVLIASILEKLYDNNAHKDSFIRVIVSEYTNEIVTEVNHFFYLKELLKQETSLLKKAVEEAYQCPDLLPFLDDSFFRLLEKGLMALSFQEDPFQNLQNLWATYTLNFKKFCEKLFKHCTPGDVFLHSKTGHLRPILCRLLNISPLPMIIPDFSTAIAIDNNIANFLPLISSPPEIQSTTKLVSPLNVPRGNGELPQTYARPITPLLLLQIIQYWRLTSQEKGADLPPLLQNFADIVNRGSHLELNEELPVSAINQLKSCIALDHGLSSKALDFSSLKKDNRIQRIIEALRVTSTLDQQTLANQTVVDDNPHVSIAVIEKIIKHYQGSSLQEQKEKKQKADDFLRKAFGLVYRFKPTQENINALSSFIMMARNRHREKENDFHLFQTEFHLQFSTSIPTEKESTSFKGNTYILVRTHGKWQLFFYDGRNKGLEIDIQQYEEVHGLHDALSKLPNKLPEKFTQKHKETVITLLRNYNNSRRSNGEGKTFHLRFCSSMPTQENVAQFTGNTYVLVRIEKNWKLYFYDGTNTTAEEINLEKRETITGLNDVLLRLPNKLLTSLSVKEQKPVRILLNNYDSIYKCEMGKLAACLNGKIHKDVLIKISDLENLLEAYNPKPKTQDETKIQRNKRQQLFAKVGGSIYKFAGVSHAIQDLINFVSTSRIRHQQQQGHYYLDIKEIELIKQLLQARLKELLDIENPIDGLKLFKGMIETDDADTQAYIVLLRELSGGSLQTFFNLYFPNLLKVTEAPLCAKKRVYSYMLADLDKSEEDEEVIAQDIDNTVNNEIMVKNEDYLQEDNEELIKIINKIPHTSFDERLTALQSITYGTIDDSELAEIVNIGLDTEQSNEKKLDAIQQYLDDSFSILQRINIIQIALEIKFTKEQKINIAEAEIAKQALTIDDLDLEYLAYISGYLIDITWVIDIYKTQNKLVNPYTYVELTPHEFLDLLRHANDEQCNTFIAHWQNLNKDNLKSNKGNKEQAYRLTFRCVEALDDLIAGSVFHDGTRRYYRDKENKKASLAYATFYKFVASIPMLERNVLYNHEIPKFPHEDGNCSTIEELLRIGSEQCIAGTGKKLARVVYQYKGEVKLPLDALNELEPSFKLLSRLEALPDDTFALSMADIRRMGPIPDFFEREYNLLNDVFFTLMAKQLNNTPVNKSENLSMPGELKKSRKFF